MELNDAADWLTWLGIVIPLASLAWSANHWIDLRKEDQRQRTFNRFFETLTKVHNAEGSLINQKAAIYELRNFPEYGPVILRICQEAPVIFTAPTDPIQLLHHNSVLEEFKLTEKHLLG